MKKVIFGWIFFSIAALDLQLSAEAKIRVVAVLPDAGWLVRELAGDRAELTVLLTGREDPHYLTARPSYILAAHRADAFIDPGMQLTVGYVPLILKNSRNSKIQVGMPGFIDTSIFIDKLDVPTRLSRAAGDVHPQGNPHYNLDPVRMIEAARAVAIGLARIDPKNSKLYRKNFLRLREKLIRRLVGDVLVDAVGPDKLLFLLKKNRLIPFLKRVRAGNRPIIRYLGGWLREMLPFRGSAFISHHKLWSYFAQRFGLVSLGELEPKPGIPPSAKHLRRIIRLASEKRPRWIFAASYQPLKTARFVSKKTGIPYLVLPVLVNAVPSVKTYPQMIDYIIAQIKKSSKK